MYCPSLKQLTLLIAMISSQNAASADRLLEDVPLPADVEVAEISDGNPNQRWLGAWTGAWGGSLKHVMVVESIAGEGEARVIYAIGDNLSLDIRRQWSRHVAEISGHKLQIAKGKFSATYELLPSGQAKAFYKLGEIRSFALLKRVALDELIDPGTRVDWTSGDSELVLTDLIEDGKPVHLEIVTFTPAGDGPFPLAVLNHGSTGRGTDPQSFTKTWVDPRLAVFLNERGWMVAFPQRRGRGRSEGLYDEGFYADRTRGYTCDSEISLRGAERALDDLYAAVAALRHRGDVAQSRILIGGQSRGGVLSIAYSGRHPDQVAGAINFVGGWLGDGCSSAHLVNTTLFKQGAGFGRQTLWLYGRNDPFYTIQHSRKNFEAFESAAGEGLFMEFDVPGGYGHGLIGYDALWSEPIERYLHSMAERDRR